MSNIRIDVDYTIKDGTEIKFRSPVDCSQITGLIVYYPGADGNTVSKVFALSDAHGNNVGDIDHLFAEDVVVKVILDVTKSMAFVQNADTNAYLEAQLASKASAGFGYGEALKVIDQNAEVDFEARLNSELATMADKQSKQIAFSCNNGLKGGTTYFGTLTRNIDGYAVLYGCSADNAKVFKAVGNGVWSAFEWVNPPMVLGIEYRTTERWQGKAVYTKLINCEALPSVGTLKRVSHNEAVTQIVRVSGQLTVNSAGGGDSLPIYHPEVGFVYVFATKTYCGIYVDKWTHYINQPTDCTASMQIWYTKD